MITLSTNAEKAAEKAEALPCFSGIKLLHIRKAVSEILGHIGREKIFSTYTLHDIRHIDQLLDIVDWLVPPATKSVMTDADWMLTVLAIYFHDMGMLVTKDEFDAPAQSGFPDFCRGLTASDDDREYLAKVNELPPEERERFLYQEFVRHHHATRVKDWIWVKDIAPLASPIL